VHTAEKPEAEAEKMEAQVWWDQFMEFNKDGKMVQRQAAVADYVSGCLIADEILGKQRLVLDVKADVLQTISSRLCCNDAYYADNTVHVTYRLYRSETMAADVAAANAAVAAAGEAAEAAKKVEDGAAAHQAVINAATTAAWTASLNNATNDEVVKAGDAAAKAAKVEVMKGSKCAVVACRSCNSSCLRGRRSCCHTC
jgi:hypothetical protein